MGVYPIGAMIFGVEGRGLNNCHSADLIETLKSETSLENILAVKIRCQLVTIFTDIHLFGI